MKKKTMPILVFIFSVVSLLISVKLFWNMGIFVDEYNLTPAIVNGGEFWLLMDWLRLFLLFLAALISGINIFGKRKKE
ncbi:hypothetical protein [Clostridium sp. UBA6640]|uniref:hypothetical protein n=1 Tax=Clostridium sp. UBA6640 TaxID=1946370 RepID=UPI0025C47603|nr:hypothetical protein [Clostridium sp. UBA6640]